MEDSVLVKWAHNLLVQVGIEPETAHLLDQFVIIAMILLCALAADVICRFVILAVGRRIIVRTRSVGANCCSIGTCCASSRTSFRLH